MPPTRLPDAGSLIDEQALARVLGFDVDAIRRGVQSGALTPIETDDGQRFDLDAVHEELDAAGWDGRDPLLTAEQAAGRLGVEVTELEALEIDGKLHGLVPLPGVSVRYRATEIEEIVDGGRIVAVATRTRHGLRLIATNAVLLVAILLAIFPFIALIHGESVLAAPTQPRTVPELIGEFALHVIAIGVLGTVVVNLLRITLVSILAANAGYYPAIFLHDWAATLFTVVWLVGFWAFAQRWILGWEPTPA